MLRSEKLIAAALPIDASIDDEVWYINYLRAKSTLSLCCITSTMPSDLMHLRALSNAGRCI